MPDDVLLCLFAAIVRACLIFGNPVGNQPEFLEPITNQTVPLGRDATFTCVVKNLKGYRIGWVKTDSKAIQAIHDHVITQNSRIWVSNNDQSTWNLHIKNVQEDDRGEYMCQVNTDPMKSQTGYLDVVIPPDIIYEETSGDLMVQEGGSARLVCKARGYPQPHITWRREDNEDIIRKDVSGVKKVSHYEGEVLILSRVSRNEMGAYLCIASNGIPPSVSKRITISVHFHPVIHVPNQLVGAPGSTDVSIECNVEAYPKPIIYWIRETGQMLVTNDKYDVKTAPGGSQFETKMTLKVKNFQPWDSGTYKCNAKNSVGEVESSIRLYEIHGQTFRPKTDIEDNREESFHKSNNRKGEKNKGYSVHPKNDNSVNNIVKHSNKVSPNRSLTLRCRPHVKMVLGSTAIIVIASVKKFLINL